MTETTENRPLWSRRDVRIAVPARALSTLGDSVLTIVLLLYVQHTGAGAWALAAVLAVESLPIVLLARWAGTVADTYDSRMVLVATAAAQFAVCAALAFTAPLAGVLALALVVQTGQAIAGPTLRPRVRVPAASAAAVAATPAATKDTTSSYLIETINLWLVR